MKIIHALIACLLLTTSLAGCLGGDDPTTGCTDSDAVNYDSTADEGDDSCVMPASQSELESAAITQMLALDQSRANGESYGVETVVKTDVEIDGDSMVTEITTIEVFDAENDAMRYTYTYAMDGMQMAYYEVRQNGEIINVNSEDEWYNLNDELENVTELLDALILQGTGDDATMDPYFTCENGYEVPMEWVNDGMEHCEDGTDEGVSQEEIDELMATGRQSPLFFGEDRFAEYDWSMTVEKGYQTIFTTVDNETYYINFDSDLKMVSLVAKSSTSADTFGVGFENVESKISIIDVDVKTISDTYPAAASPFLLERNYDAREYLWDCNWAADIPGDQMVTFDEINAIKEQVTEEEMPEWCNEYYNDNASIHTFADMTDIDYFWNAGFSTDKHKGGWDGWSEDYHTMRIEDGNLVTTSVDAAANIQLFYCEGGSVEISQINDGTVDCSDGADEGLQPDLENEIYLRCSGLGQFTHAVYVEATDSCETTTNLTFLEMDDEYLHFILDDTLEMWNYEDRYKGTEFWFKRSTASEIGENLSVVAELNYYSLGESTRDGLYGYGYLVEDEMKFQNSLTEFRLDLGYTEYNEDLEEDEFTLHVSFDLAQMESGQATDSSGNNWTFTYTDVNENNYLDDGDTLIIYTDAGDRWDDPTVKLYHLWGDGYTDESPALLPGFTMLGTLCLLIVVALKRRPDDQ